MQSTYFNWARAQELFNVQYHLGIWDQNLDTNKQDVNYQREMGKIYPKLLVPWLHVWIGRDK